MQTETRPRLTDFVTYQRGENDIHLCSNSGARQCVTLYGYGYGYESTCSTWRAVLLCLTARDFGVGTTSHLVPTNSYMAKDILPAIMSRLLVLVGQTMMGQLCLHAALPGSTTIILVGAEHASSSANPNTTRYLAETC